MEHFDVAVIGAGAAGLMCAARAGARGRRVVLIEHASKLAEKIRISGGGRCNFTNLYTSSINFVSENPDFCRSALARYTPADFIALLTRHGIHYHEKHRGQMFCNRSSEDIIKMLAAECDEARVQWRMPSTVHHVSAGADGFTLAATTGPLMVKKLVIATGGLSIPKIGATDWGYRLARQFGLKVTTPTPALVPLTFDSKVSQELSGLAGISLEVAIRSQSTRSSVAPIFHEDLLFTHRGLSGPAVLQISTYWEPGMALRIDLAPRIDLAAELVATKRRQRQTLLNTLSQWLPKRLVAGWLDAYCSDAAFLGAQKVADIPDKVLQELAGSINGWTVTPAGTEGFRKAEVTRGGVATHHLSSQTMQANHVFGLYFIGEVVDVTGWLGGYNFQWAWASAVAAAMAL